MSLVNTNSFHNNTVMEKKLQYEMNSKTNKYLTKPKMVDIEPSSTNFLEMGPLNTKIKKLLSQLEQERGMYEEEREKWMEKEIDYTKELHSLKHTLNVYINKYGNKLLNENKLFPFQDSFFNENNIQTRTIPSSELVKKLDMTNKESIQQEIVNSKLMAEIEYLQNEIHDLQSANSRLEQENESSRLYIQRILNAISYISGGMETVLDKHFFDE
ncbi:hypothetical protein BB559_000273 [Furculomyces boomerangus]|uniref:Uncharacterized protein n=2 Tax=Harpellales TaxID=61421 RepID=A0A2T9Z5W4_9FUNG|nr:hypothetical protein BB559_000273 [Furculomyces boomerangus]PVZ99839.1 hypothetical protein BB558_004124 [Smittium angustum]